MDDGKNRPRLLLQDRDCNPGLLIDVADGPGEHGLHQRAQSEQGFIKQKQFGLGHQGPSNGKHLLLSSRLGLATKAAVAPLLDRCEGEGKQIRALIRTLQAKQAK